MKSLRAVAILLALSLMLGELWRSWGAGRPIAFVLDDQIMGLVLILGAILVQSPTTRRRALFSAGWGLNSGMLYSSFFNKVYAPETEQAGNWNVGILTFLVGLAFFIAVVGLVLSVTMRTTVQTPPEI